MPGAAVSRRRGLLTVATRDVDLLSDIHRLEPTLGVDCRRVGRGQDLVEGVFPEGGLDRVRMLLLDEDLPDISGSSLLVHLRDMDPALKVIFMARQASPALEMQARQEGVLFFLHKPVDPAILSNVIKRAVEHETSRRRAAC